MFNCWNLALAFGDHYMHTRPPILLSTYNMGLCHFPPPQESRMKLPPPPPWLACRTPWHFAGRGWRTNKSIRPLEQIVSESPSFPQWTQPLKYYKFRPRFQAVNGCPLIKPCHQPIWAQGPKEDGKEGGDISLPSCLPPHSLQIPGKCSQKAWRSWSGHNFPKFYSHRSLGIV